MDKRDVLLIVVREQLSPTPVIRYLKKLGEFIKFAQQEGYVRKDFNPDMLTGFLNDRVLNQIQFSPWIKENFNLDIYEDKKYRDEWCKSNRDLLLFRITT